MKRTIAFAVLSLVLLFGCHNSKKPSDSNFTTAINLYLSKHGTTCISITQPLPIDVPVKRLNDLSGTAPEMAALERAGLLRSVNTIAVVHGLLDALRGPTPAQPVRRYELTADGKRYFRQYPTLIGQMNGFCYGDEQVDSIVKWDEPSTQGAYSSTEVTYTYKVEQLADWAKRPDVEQAFPVIKTKLDQAKANQIIDLHLTNKEWAAEASER